MTRSTAPPEEASEALDGLARTPTRRDSGGRAGRQPWGTSPIAWSIAARQAVGGLLDPPRHALGRPPRERVGDRGQGGETAPRDGLERGAPPPLGARAITNPHGGLGRDDLTSPPDRDLDLRPQSKGLRRLTKSALPRQTVDEPSTGTAQGCPPRLPCPPGARDQVITWGWDRAAIEGRPARAGPDLAEPDFADAEEQPGLARAPLRRRSKVQIQALLTAAAINLKQLAARRLQAQVRRAALTRRHGHHLASGPCLARRGRRPRPTWGAAGTSSSTSAGTHVPDDSGCLPQQPRAATNARGGRRRCGWPGRRQSRREFSA